MGMLDAPWRDLVAWPEPERRWPGTGSR